MPHSLFSGLLLFAKGNKTYKIAELWTECKRVKCTFINNATKKFVNSKNLTYNIYTICMK